MEQEWNPTVPFLFHSIDHESGDYPIQQEGDRTGQGNGLWGCCDLPSALSCLLPETFALLDRLLSLCFQ